MKDKHPEIRALAKEQYEMQNRYNNIFFEHIVIKLPCNLEIMKYNKRRNTSSHFYNVFYKNLYSF